MAPWYHPGVTRQDRRFPDLHEPAEDGGANRPTGGGAPVQAPRFAEIFAPAPELPEPPVPPAPAGERAGAAAVPPAPPFVDEENPFGVPSDRARGPRRARDAGTSFEELVSEIFPPEEPPAPAWPVGEPRGSRLRWLLPALLVIVAAAAAYHYRGRLLAVVRGGSEATGAALPIPGPEVLPAPTEAAAPGAVTAAVETAVPEPTPPAGPPPAPTPGFVDPASLPPATRIASARWVSAPEGGAVVLQADGGVVPHRIRRLRLENPPRELVRISGIVAPTEPDTVAVGGPLVARVRLGHHPELSPPELYVVIDLAAPTARAAAPESAGDTVRIAVR